MILRLWTFDSKKSRRVGSISANALDIDADGERLVYSLGSKVYLRWLANWAAGPELLAEHSAPVRSVAFHPSGDRVAMSDETGRISICSVHKAGLPLRVLGPEEETGPVEFSPGGRWLAAEGEKNHLWILRLWDLSAPEGAAPLEIRTDSGFINEWTFDPSERWLVTNHADHTFYWPLGDIPARLEGHRSRVDDIAFTPDGSTLLSVSDDGTLRAWPLDPETSSKPRVLLETPTLFPKIAVDPGGARVVVSARAGRVLVVPLEGGRVRELGGFSKDASVIAVSISPDGRLAAAAPHVAPIGDKFIHIWNLETGAPETKLPIPGAGEGFQGAIESLSFVDEDHLLAGSANFTPILLFDMRDGSTRVLAEFHAEALAVSSTGRFGFGADEGGNMIRFGLNDGITTPVASHAGAYPVTLNENETFLASGGLDGIVRVGPISGTEPQLLFGHSALIRSVAFSPDGRWLASSGDDHTIRLWRVPDVTKTPPHKLPHEEFLSMLRSRTNVRVVLDSNSPTGWRLDADPFPGWGKRPEP